MKVEELVALLMVELKEDIVGMISREGNAIVIDFGDDEKRIITVQ